MLTLERWFPTIVGYKINPSHDELETELTNHCYNIQDTVESGGNDWISNSTYNTSSGNHDCLSDSKFAKLNEWVIATVNEYADELKISKPLIPQSSWFNVYNRYDYQEFHAHPGAHISAIYFLKGSEDGAKVYFKDNTNDMLNIKYNEGTNDNFGSVHYKPLPGMLVMFLSNTYHAVERHDVTDERISLSYNFLQVAP